MLRFRHLIPVVILMIFLIFVSFNNINAQPYTEICNAAFSQGIRDNYYLLSINDQFNFYQSRLCRANFLSYDHFRETSQSTQLDIATAEFLLGLTGSDSQRAQVFLTKYSTFCHSTLAESSLSVRFNQVINRVSSALTSSWNRCQELHLQAWMLSQGVFLEVTPYDQMNRFVARISVRHQGQIQPIVINSISPDDVECRSGRRLVRPGSRFNSASFSMTCSKNPAIEMPFIIDTNLGSTQTVRVPSVTPWILTYNDQLDKLRNSISRAEIRLNEINERFRGDTVRVGEKCFKPIQLRLCTNGHDAASWIWQQCPSGYYHTNHSMHPIERPTLILVETQCP